MNEITWGPEIAVDGNRPYWLVDGEDVKCFTTVWHSRFLIPSQIDWPIIRKIKLRADHPHYATQSHPTAPIPSEVGPEVVERVRDAPRAEIERQCGIGAGEFVIDDGYGQSGLWRIDADLDPVALVRAAALLPEPVDADEVLARQMVIDENIERTGKQRQAIADGNAGQRKVALVLAAIKRGRALAAGDR